MAKHPNTFLLLHQIEPRSTQCWRIAEVFPTIDGLRTRMTTWSFASEEEARDWIKRRKEDS